MTEMRSRSDLMQPELPLGGAIDFLQRTLKTTARRDLDAVRVVLSKLAHELDDGPRSRVIGEVARS